MSFRVRSNWLKPMLGVAFVIAGGALLFWTASKTDLSSSLGANGVPLFGLIGAALGLGALGAGADLLGFGRRRAASSKIRNTKVYGAAEPASEREAKAAAHGDMRTPLHDRSFAD